jgi:riboflavin biosynthesis pyrimidine reductase
VRRVWPDPVDDLSVDEAVNHERRPHESGRAWLMLCMVMSLDGSTVVEGRSGALSHPVDAALLAALRRQADVILVGAGTVRAEGYGPPKRPGQRIVVVSRTGNVDYRAPLFTSGAGVLALPEDAPQVPIPTIRAGTGSVDVAGVMAQLDADVVQAEGGASLNAALAAADLVDELNVTLAPMVTGGDGPRLTNGAPDMTRRLRLAQLAEHDDYVFMRWLRTRT